jgi:hypothetical protein
VSHLRRWIPLAAVVVLLGLAMFLAVSGSVGMERVPPLVGEPAPPPQGEEPATVEPLPVPTGSGEEMFNLPPWVGYLFGALCIGFVAVVVGAAIWSIVRDRLSERLPVVEPASPEELRREAQERIRAAVDVGLADLDVADQDPRRAVIACWARLEAAAAAAGTEREPGDSSSEFVQRLLAEHAVTAPVLAGLAAVYREARFATHAVDETMREQARAALRQLRDEFVNEIPAGGS